MARGKAKKVYLGIDIGGTKIYTVVATAKCKVLARAKRKTRGETGFDRVISRVNDTAHDACQAAGVSMGKLAGVGVVAPGPTLPDGTVVHAPNLGWVDAPLGVELAEALGREVAVINDCNAGTLAEVAFGAARGATSAVGLFVGTGLGGGIVLDGRVVDGANHLAAELGHMKVVAEGGRPCGCGGLGCLEAYASKTGLGYFVTHQIVCEGRPSLLTELCDGVASYRNIRSGLLSKAYQAGDAVAVEALHQLADYLGLGVANCLTILGPKVVVLGGGVMEALGDALLPRVTAAAKQHTFPVDSFSDATIKVAGLGDDAVALGAVAWAAARRRS